MFSLEKSYGFDKSAAEAGVTMVVGPDPETDFVIVRRMPNDQYRTKLSSAMLANRKMLEILKAQDEAAHAKRDNEIFCEVIAETIIAGWGPGIIDEGEFVPFSAAAAKALLIKYPDFRSDIIDFASTKSNYPLKLDVAEIKKK